MNNPTNYLPISHYVDKVLDDVTSSPLLSPLKTAFHDSAAELEQIEEGFKAFTSQFPTLEQRRTFLHSWSLTNHSAMCVSGLSNRLSMHIHRGDELPNKEALVSAIVELNRISDEDLGAQGGELHHDMYYTMGVYLTGDDSWKCRRYAVPSASEFYDYKNRYSLRHPDPMMGILTTVVHEVYTHGEVEYILPLFDHAVENHYALSGQDKAQCLTWIRVHCGGTEANHFSHSLLAAKHYVEALNIDLASYDLVKIFKEYIAMKANVMQALSFELLEQQAI